METITTVPKEQLNSVRFYQSEVISEKVLRLIRQYDLNRALVLGNIDHNKVTIIFKTADGSLLQVKTTVWAVTDEYICLKGNIYVPIKAIVDIVI